MNIPTITHQFDLGGEELPERYAKCHESLKTLHAGYDLRLYSHSSSLELLEHRAIPEHVRSRIPGFWNTLSGCYRPLPLKSDLLKMLAVYCCGGVALDLDLYFVRPIDDLLERELLLANVTDEPKLVSEAVIGAPAGSPRVLRMICDFLTRTPSSEGVITANLSGQCRKYGWPSVGSDFFVPHGRGDDDSRNYFVTDDTRSIHLWHDKDYDFRKLGQLRKKANGSQRQ